MDRGQITDVKAGYRTKRGPFQNYESPFSLRPRYSHSCTRLAISDQAIVYQAVIWRGPLSRGIGSLKPGTYPRHKWALRPRFGPQACDYPSRHVMSPSIPLFFFCFYCLEGLSVHSDHCRAMGYRIWRVTVDLEEMDVARVKPKPRPGWTHLPAGGSRQLSGGQLDVGSVPVDVVHQARIM